eukprot:CAMPEP_0168824602 /NCGR_PEP_ID=MMETSP0726-20121227/11182_1 /TAXON_ID=265536 /ORGANISM="Amphiprora sp., Strain CCMP467" /LENGTH=83 /DNA_ID=CAMNT_0008877615 /DNA_START=13 /DNA_END=260 /DNA_ORIENTATION=-
MRKGKTGARATSSGCTIHGPAKTSPLYVSLPASSKDPSNRCGLQAGKGLSKFSIQVTTIVIGQQAWVVAKYDNCWWSRANLVT